jgi:Outer membrane protein beta-barrel domain
MRGILICIAVLYAGTAAAQSGEGTARSHELWVDLGVTLVSNDKLGTDQVFGGSGSASDLQLNGGFRFGARFDLSEGNYIGHEFQYVNSRAPIQYNYEPGTPTLDAAVNRGGYNFLGYFTKKGSKVRPFGTFGAQVSIYSPPLQSYLGCEYITCTVGSASPGSPIVQPPPPKGGDDKFGFNYGGGAKVIISSRFQLRLDVRQYVNGKPFNLPLASGLLRQTEVSAGVGFAF